MLVYQGLECFVMRVSDWFFLWNFIASNTDLLRNSFALVVHLDCYMYVNYHLIMVFSLQTEPYNSLKRRGRNEPEVLAAASSKRLYLENNPYLVGGYSPHMPFWNKSSSALDCSKYSVDLQKLQMHQLDPSSEMLLVSDKYKFMRDTFRKRLAFGKLFCRY